MKSNRTIMISLVLALALAPAAAIAHVGGDDPARDDRSGKRAGDRSPNSNSGSHNSGRDRARRNRREIRVAGSCTGDSSSKLKVRRDRGRLKAQFEVDENVNGVVWNVRLSRNGTVVVDTTRATHPPSGSFSIQRRLGNGAGPDTVSATATSPSGEVCTASATI